jgi:hypothetical protein
MENEKKVLSPGQYWEWRTTISEVEIAKEKQKNVALEHKILMRDSENLHLRTQLFIKTKVEQVNKKVEAAQAEYDRFKAMLETELGTSLSNKLIDDITFEIRDLPETNN